MPFPEEPLDLPVSKGGGYFPAFIHQKVNGGKYESVRKLGYGPRSSTWLVLRIADRQHFAAKFFTVAASNHAKSMELPIIKAVNKLSRHPQLPAFYGSFWEDSSAASHLCFVLNPLSTSVENLQEEADNRRLPTHVVQKIIYTVSCALKALHDEGIMHGAVRAENVVFATDMHTEFIDSLLRSESDPIVTKVKKQTTVRSQPLDHGYRWNEKMKVVADWDVYLNGFGHAQRWKYVLENGVDYSSAPETLLQQATCSTQTDIWMLGYMTFKLLTGNAPFHPKGTISKKMATIRTAIDDELPQEWLADSKMKNYDTDTHSFVSTIDEELGNVLNDRVEKPAAASFIKGCLCMNPEKRFKAEDCVGHKWLSKASACSCGFC